MHKRGFPCLLVLAGVLLVGCEDGDSLVGELAVREVVWIVDGERSVPPPEPFQPAHWRGITLYDTDPLLRDCGPPSPVGIPHYEVDEATTRKIVSGLEYRDGRDLWIESYPGVARFESRGECRIAISLASGGLLEMLMEAPFDYHISVLDESGYYGYYVVRGTARDELRRVFHQARETFLAIRVAEEKKRREEEAE